MHQDERPERLLARAQAYLRDAANEANSTHTRYASAMNALGCLYHAGQRAPRTGSESRLGKPCVTTFQWRRPRTLCWRWCNASRRC